MKDYPLVRITIVYISGILFQKTFDPGLWVILIPAIISLIYISILLFLKPPHKQIIYTAGILCAVFCMAALNYSLGQKSIKKYPFDQSYLKDAMLSGTVVSVELNRSYEFRLIMRADSVKYDGKVNCLDNEIICRIRDEEKQTLENIYNRIAPGNYLSIKGTISKARGIRNPGEFDYQQYYEQKGISAQIVCRKGSDVSIISNRKSLFASALFSVRKSIYEYMLKLHDYRTASLMKGLLLADRSDIGKDIENDFVNTGVVHVLAVSGLHIVYIMTIFYFLFGRINIIARSWLIMAGLIAFLLLTGFLPSVLRAVIMSSALLVAYLTNRSTDIKNILALSALLLLLFDPAQLFDPGFQLSYVSVIAIVLLTPFFRARTSRIFTGHLLIQKFLLFISVTISAQIGTLPFTLLYFGRLSLIAIVANIIIIPLSGLIIAVGIFTLLLAPFIYPLVALYAHVNIFLTTCMYKITSLLSAFRFSYISIRNFSAADGVIYFVMICVFFFLYSRMNSWKTKMMLLILTTVNVILLTSVDDRELLKPGMLSLVTIDVGQGDAFLLKMPDETTMLIDAGLADSYFDYGERVIIPLLDYMGIDKVSYGCISHFDADHYGGFATLIEQGRIGYLLKPPADTADAASMKLEKFLKSRNVNYGAYSRRMFSRNGCRVYFLHTEADRTLSRNNRSAVIKVVYGRVSMLFTGDAGLKQERLLIDRYGDFLKADILKVSHHGSAEGTSEEFLKYVSPSYAIISVAGNNRFNHPSGRVTSALTGRGIKIMRTDKSGAVILQSDGSDVQRVQWR